MDSNDTLIGSIDQGTSSTRVILFNTKGEAVHSHQIEFDSIYPQPGWVEQDPNSLWKTVIECMEAVYAQCSVSQRQKVKAFGITNQRETSILWDSQTGKPFSHAVVWLDTRTSEICSELIKELGSQDYFRSICGLPIANYFSAMKLKWLIQNVPEVHQACLRGTCLFGNVDTWIIWNLTGGTKGGIHITDVTNASRTMLLNLNSLQWDTSVCQKLGIPMNILPTIRSSSELYANIAVSSFAGIPISGCLGDQQAAMVGQQCFHPGDAKNTYGTGCFMLFNTGSQIVQSSHGLLTTVGYQLGPKEPAVYALEGSVAIAGAGVKWLRDNLGIINQASDINALATSVADSAGIYFVPAFSGLFAPYWRQDARGVIVGLTQYTTKAHLARAVLEATCFQTNDVIKAMKKDSGVELKRLKVDGGMTASELLLQTQADILGIPVVLPSVREITALGAAYAAGLGVGIWTSVSQLPKSDSCEYFPHIPAKQRESRCHSWSKAVQRSFDWID